jgi:hypothetical protein
MYAQPIPWDSKDEEIFAMLDLIFALDSKDEEIFAMLDLIFALQTSKIRRQ